MSASQRLSKGVAASGGVGDNGVHLLQRKGRAVALTQFLYPVKSHVFMESAAAPLGFRDNDLDIVFYENAECGEVDLTEKRLHHASREEGNSWSGGPVLCHELAGIVGCPLEDGGIALEEKPVQRSAQRAEQSGRKEREIQGGLVFHQMRRDAKRPFGFEPALLYLLVTRLFEEFPEGHMGGAGGFTGKAADAFGGVKIRHWIRLKPSGGLLSPEADTAPWRIVFVACQIVSGAGGETKTAVGAV